MADIPLPKDQTDAAQFILELMAAAPVPLSVHQRGREALAVLLQALAPKQAETPPEAPTGPKLVV